MQELIINMKDIILLLGLFTALHRKGIENTTTELSGTNLTKVPVYCGHS